MPWGEKYHIFARVVRRAAPGLVRVIVSAHNYQLPLVERLLWIMRIDTLALAVVLVAEPLMAFVVPFRPRTNRMSVATFASAPGVFGVAMLPEFIAMEDTNYPNLQEKTDPFLDTTQYPLGFTAAESFERGVANFECMGSNGLPHGGVNSCGDS